MEFEISKTDFVEGLYLTQGVAEKRNTLPILSNVLIEPVEGGLSIFATDLDVGVRRTCVGAVKGSGALTVSARKLYEIVREAPGETILVRGMEGHGVEVRSGKSRFRLLGLDPKEFPAVPGLAAKPGKGATTMQGSVATLGAMIESTIFAVSVDETRYNLSGVFVEDHDGWLRMVATDGHRLAMVDRKIDGKLPEKGVILPRKGLVEVKKLLEASGGDEVTFSIDGAIARVVRGAVELFMRLVDGEFPDYRQVIPERGRISIVLKRDDLLDSLRRVSILSTEKAKGVRVAMKPGTLEVQTNNPDLGEASEDLGIDYAGDPVTIGFNARYLIEALSVMPPGGNVEFAVSDDVSPGVMRAEGDEHYCYVVMPMRL